MTVIFYESDYLLANDSLHLHTPKHTDLHFISGIKPSLEYETSISYCYNTGSENAGIIEAMLAHILWSLFWFWRLLQGRKCVFHSSDCVITATRKKNLHHPLMVQNLDNATARKKETSCSVFRPHFSLHHHHLKCLKSSEKLQFSYEIHAVWEWRHRWSSAASPESGGEAECLVTSLKIHAFVYCFLSLTPSRPDSSTQRTDGDLCPAVLLVISPPESQHLLPNK